MIKEVKSNIVVTEEMRKTIHSIVYETFEQFEDNLTDIVIKVNSIKEVTILTKFKEQARFNKVTGKGTTFTEAVTSAKDKALKKAKQYEDKIRHAQAKFGGFQLVDTPVELEIEEHSFNINKIKKFKMEPMHVEEAIVHMNELGHGFYFYLDAGIYKPCVVYRRNDGDYGIIEGEFE